MVEGLYRAGVLHAQLEYAFVQLSTTLASGLINHILSKLVVNNDIGNHVALCVVFSRSIHFHVFDKWAPLRRLQFPIRYFPVLSNLHVCIVIITIIIRLIRSETSQSYQSLKQLNLIGPQKNSVLFAGFRRILGHICSFL